MKDVFGNTPQVGDWFAAATKSCGQVSLRVGMITAIFPNRIQFRCKIKDWKNYDHELYKPGEKTILNNIWSAPFLIVSEPL